MHAHAHAHAHAHTRAHAQHAHTRGSRTPNTHAYKGCVVTQLKLYDASEVAYLLPLRRRRTSETNTEQTGTSAHADTTGTTQARATP